MSPGKDETRYVDIYIYINFIVEFIVIFVSNITLHNIF